MSNMRILACIATVAVFIAAFAPGAASAQMVPDTADPYELAPQNVHLYPVSLNARNPFYYLPPIFAPTPMWRGALDADIMHTFAPHNYVVYEIPDSTALTAWGTVKGDKRFVLEAANQQEFIILPPDSMNDGSSFFLVRTSMRYLPKCTAEELSEIFDRELMLDSSRVRSIAEQIPVSQLLNNYERVDDVADIQPRMHPILFEDEFATKPWPAERIYMNYSGWRRDPNRIRTNPDTIPHWFTAEGKVVALREHDGEHYMLTVEFEGYNPWYPLETAKNVMRKMMGLSFNEFVETERYYDVENPLNGKEWHRFGSPDITPFDTRRHTGSGSAGQGAY